MFVCALTLLAVVVRRVCVAPVRSSTVSPDAVTQGHIQLADHVMCHNEVAINGLLSKPE